MNHLQLNSNSKYNITLKAPPELVCTKNTALGGMSRDKYSTRLRLVLYFPYSTRGGALSNMYRTFGSAFGLSCIVYGSPKVPKPLNREGNSSSTIAV